MAKNHHRAKVRPATHRPIPPIPQATTASPARQPPFQLAQAAIGIPALLFALGVGMIPQSFWGAVILMTVSLPLFWWMLFRTFAPTARFVRPFGLLISLIVYAWMVWVIFIRASVIADVTHNTHPWDDTFSEVLVILKNVGNDDFSNVDVDVVSNITMTKPTINAQINSCSAYPWTSAPFNDIIIKLENAPVMRLDAANTSATSYRIHCEKILWGSSLEVHLPAAPGPEGRKQAFEFAEIWVSGMAGYHPVCWTAQKQIKPSALDVTRPGKTQSLLSQTLRSPFLERFTNRFGICL